jgi:protein-disulfide isomerase
VTPEISKNQRKDAAREKAREMREQERKRRRRNSIILRTSVPLVIVAAAVAITFAILSIKPAPVGTSPLNMLSDGILFKGVNGVAEPVQTKAIPKNGKPVPTDASALSDTVNIVTYIDLFCPVCQSFETTNADQIEQLVTSGLATLEVHPISFLDRSSQGTRYASRAANAAACVANYEPGKFLKVTAAFYSSQPKEGTTGLTNAQIIELVQSGGAKSDSVKNCINDEVFKDWVTATTKRATAGPLPNATDHPTVTGTPTVLVNGVYFSGPWDDPNEFIKFVDSVASAG